MISKGWKCIRTWLLCHLDEPVTAIDVLPPGLTEAREPESVLYQTGMTMADVEKAAIEGALRDHDGNRRKAADALGIGERTLYRKIKEFELE